jgi:four helix bundle protein
MSGIRDREVEVRTKSEASTFENLEVFRRAYQVSLDLHRASLQFPKIEQFAGLAAQKRRASKSICGNIAEGYGKRRRSSAEFKCYLLMAIGSADEVRVWLRYCSDLEYIDQKRCAQWREEYREIARMLQGLYTKLSSSSDP